MAQPSLSYYVDDEAPVAPIFEHLLFRLVGCLWGQAIYLPIVSSMPLDQDQVDTLLDLARQGNEVTFRDLARCWGVEAGNLDELWQGTVARVRQDSKEGRERG